jgi:hypothetical protein
MQNIDKYRKLLSGELTVYDVDVSDDDIVEMQDLVMYAIACKVAGDPALVYWDAEPVLH